MINWLCSRITWAGLQHLVNRDDKESEIGRTADLIYRRRLTVVHDDHADETVDVEGLSFRVMPALGGTIVQIKSYDEKRDRTITNTHVIPEGEDIAECVGRIVSLEILRA
jgi:hypothetical protein